jgi:membrane protein implicated in regulation of membrane protease activity
MDLGLHDGWLWAIGGILLLIAEVVAPGFFLVFLGAAAIATGLFTLLFDLGIAPQLALFVVYTGLALVIGKRWYGEPDVADHVGGLNDPARRLVGKSATVVETIDEHQGRVRLGDSEWTARGGPAAQGERVEIIGVDGNCLLVGTARMIGTTSGEL